MVFLKLENTEQQFYIQLKQQLFSNYSTKSSHHRLWKREVSISVFILVSVVPFWLVLACPGLSCPALSCLVLFSVLSCRVLC